MSTIDLIKDFNMVNHSKLVSAFTLSALSNKSKRWLSAYLKGRTTSCWYNFTISPSFHARVRVPQGTCISPTLFNFFFLHIPSVQQPSSQLPCKWLHCFLFQLLRCSNGWIPYHPYIKYWGVGGWTRFNQIYHHFFHPSIRTIKHPSLSHSQQLIATS